LIVALKNSCCHFAVAAAVTPSYPVCQLLIFVLIFSYCLLLPPLVCCPAVVDFDAATVAFSPLQRVRIMSFSPLAALHCNNDDADMSRYCW